MGRGCIASILPKRKRDAEPEGLLLARTFLPRMSMATLIAALSLLATGLLAGNELAVALFIHPVLYRVPDAAHATVVPR